MGGVRVEFLPSGLFAPLIFVSSGQINAIVPYGVAGQLNVSIEVLYLGQTSNSFNLSLVPTAPGMFTQSALGTGPGAILQYDSQGNYQGENTAQNPAHRGYTLVIYLTGEGSVLPQPVSGSVTPNVTNPPVPLFQPSVLIGSAPATVAFYGEAPNLVSGVLQINAIVPQNAPLGNDTISVAIGTGANSSSQAGVTVNVQ